MAGVPTMDADVDHQLSKDLADKVCLYYYVDDGRGVPSFQPGCRNGRTT
jgi:hypothetical protein